VIEMMVYLGTLKGLPQQEAQKRSMALLEKLQLHESAKKKVSELSKGMQQKVQFAVTILHQPDLIIIDEPFSGLDPVNALALQEMIYDLKRQGVTIVMSTHQMYQVEEMAERLLMLHKGQLQLYGGVQEIRQRYALHAVNVDGEGDWAALQGVASVHRLGNSENGTGKSGYQLQLHPDVQTSEVLAAITRTPNMHLQRFELAVPSLNDIFIRVVENANEKASVV
jgi:ABC-2 type transport system ATP-binding protein